MDVNIDHAWSDVGAACVKGLARAQAGWRSIREDLGDAAVSDQKRAKLDAVREHDPGVGDE